MRTYFHSYATLGLVGSLKQVDSGGSECPPSALTKPSCGISAPARSQSSKPNDEKLPQKYGRILRDADGKVVGVEMLGEKETNGEKGDLADAEEVNEHDTRPNKDLIIGASHIVRDDY